MAKPLLGNKMSRIGKKPVPLPKGVEVTVDNGTVRVKGPKGTLERTLSPAVSVAVVRDADGAANQILVSRNREDRTGREQHGLWRALVKNMVKGVSEGVGKVLEIVGVGYRAELQGNTLRVNLGFATPATIKVPEGVSVEVKRPTRPGIDGEIHVSGIDAEIVGQFAARARKLKPPDSYKGKGIRYRDEQVRKLPGKTFTSGG